MKVGRKRWDGGCCRTKKKNNKENIKPSAATLQPRLDLSYIQKSHFHKPLRGMDDFYCLKYSHSHGISCNRSVNRYKIAFISTCTGHYLEYCIPCRAPLRLARHIDRHSWRHQLWRGVPRDPPTGVPLETTPRPVHGDCSRGLDSQPPCVLRLPQDFTCAVKLVSQTNNVSIVPGLCGRHFSHV